MKVAAATYPIDWMEGFGCLGDKLDGWVAEAAGQGAALLVFPEYGAYELAAFAGRDVAGDTAAAMAAVSARLPEYWDLMAGLAARHGVHILAGSGPFERPGGYVNRAMFVTPTGGRQHHDKQVMTRWERDEMGVGPGDPLVVMQTELGMIGVLICYDVEFPLLSRALVEAGAEVILVPSATEALEGYHRVRIGAQARALEGQCVVVQAPTQGAAPWNTVVDENAGTAGVFAPPDMGFPADGVLALGEMDTPGWTYGDVDPAAIRAARADGHVLTFSHWAETPARAKSVTKVRLG